MDVNISGEDPNSIIRQIAQLVDIYITHLINNDVNDVKKILYIMKNHGEFNNVTEAMIRNSIHRLTKEKTIITNDETKLLQLNNGVDILSIKSMKEVETLLTELLKVKPIRSKDKSKKKTKKDNSKKEEIKIDPTIKEKEKEFSSRVFTDEPPIKLKTPFIEKYYTSTFEMTAKDGSRICIKTDGLIEVMTNVDGDIKIIVSPSEV